MSLSDRLAEVTVLSHPRPAGRNKAFLESIGLGVQRIFLSRFGSYSIVERRVPELIPVLGSQPAGDVSHKPGGRLPLLSARPAVTHATLKRAASNLERTDLEMV